MTPPLLKNIVVAIGAILAAAIVITQCRKPKWWPGRLYLWLMNRTHAGLTSWGLEHVSVEKNDTILDVGCGGGRTIHTLAAMAPEGKVHGIDHSAESVAVSRKTNRESISAGRVDVQHGSVSALPFPDGTFDLVTAVETHYYWPDVVNDLREVLRVLKPGGSLVIIAEVYKRGEHDIVYPLVMRLLGGACPSVREQKDQFAAAGYADIQTFEQSRKGWFCGVARRA
jgi:SAM-dependent methyltransferase